MIPGLFYYQPMVVGLLWVFVMLSVVWSSPSRPQEQRPATPIAPPHKRSKAPTAFVGLTQKPLCARCEQASTQPQPPPALPPDLMPATNRRPRQVDTSRHFCPHAGCAYYGWVGPGNLRANGHPSGGPWRQFHCRACGGYFLETHGTLFHGKRVPPDTLVWAIAALAEGLGIRAVARVFEVDPTTVLAWLVEAAAHLKAVSRSFLHDLHVEQVPMDELFALLSAVKAGAVLEADAIKRLSRSPYWVWATIGPVTKLLLTIDVGDRTRAMAQSVVHQVLQVLAPGCVPLFLTDGFKEYATALLTHYGQWVQPARRQATGPAPKPR